MLHHLQPGAIFFSSLIDRHNRPSQRRQLTQFFLDILQPFVPLSVRDLVHGAIALLPPILFILLLNLGDFRPQTHDLVLKNSEMIHIFRIYQQSEKRSEVANAEPYSGF